MFQIKEYHFDGVDNISTLDGISRPMRKQRIDMHSFSDGTYVYYPYTDYTTTLAKDCFIARFNPATDEMQLGQLAALAGDNNGVAYQCIPSTVDADIIWIYSPYGKWGLWRYDRRLIDNPSGGYDNIYYQANGYSGAGGGKIASWDSGSGEIIVCTHVTFNPLLVFKLGSYVPDLGVKFTNFTYGCQCDDYGNFFVQDAGDQRLKAFRVNPITLVPTTPVWIASVNAVDIAWDGTYIWTCGLTSTNDTYIVEKFEPIYDVPGGVIISWTQHESKSWYTGHNVVPASIKANANYVAVAWESSYKGGPSPEPDKPNVAWSILDKTTNIWYWYINYATTTAIPEAVYPFTKQYWETVCIEVDYLGNIFIVGYVDPDDFSPGAIPSEHAHMVKLTPITNDNAIKGATIRGVSI